MATTFSRYLKPSKSEAWGSASTGKLPSGILAIHLTYPDLTYLLPPNNWQSGVNTTNWKEGLTVLVRTPLAAASSTIAEAQNVVPVDLKAAAIANPSLNFDLGSENATRMIAAKINSRRIQQVGTSGATGFLRATYVRQSLPHKYQILGATFLSTGGGGEENILLEIATRSHHGFPSEMLNDFVLRVENASSTKNVTNADYANVPLKHRRRGAASYNALVECELPSGTVNGSPTVGDALNNTFTLVGETPKHTIALAWELDEPNTDNGYWGEQNGGPVIQGMGSIGVHRLVAKPMDGGNRGIPSLQYQTKSGKRAEKNGLTELVGYNRFSIEGLNSCNLPELPPPDFHSIYPTIRGITTIHPDAETQAVSNNRLLIQSLEYGTEFTIAGDEGEQTIAFDTGQSNTSTDFTATVEQAYVPTGANGVHIKNYNPHNATRFREMVGVAGGTDVYAREFMTTMTVNEERVGLHISNEEKVFESMNVIDDLGNQFVLEGGSPFGTVIRDFKINNVRKNPTTAEMHVGPSSASGDVEPNLRIQLPKQEEIPGGIFVRSGHDRVQAWSNLSWGMGGLSPPKPEKAGVLEAHGEPSSYDTNDRSLIFHCQRILGNQVNEVNGLNGKNYQGKGGHTRIFAAHRASDHVERGSLLKQTNNGVETGNLFPHDRIRFGRYGHTFVSPTTHRGTPQSLRRQLHRSHGAAYSLMFEAETEYKHHGFGNGDPTGNTSSVFQLDSIDVKNSGSNYSTGSFASDGLPLDELKGKRHFKSDSKYTSATHRSIPDFLFAPGQTHTNVEGTPEFVSFAEGAIDGSIPTGSATKLNLQGSTFSVRNRFNTASEVMINGFFLNNYMGIGGRPEPIKVVGKDAFNNWFLRGYHEGVIRPRVATELATVPPLISHDPELLNANSDDTDKRDMGLAKAENTTSGGTPDAFLCNWLAEFSHPILYGTSREFFMTFRYREAGMPRSVNYPSTNGLFLRNYSNQTIDGQAEKALPFERLYIAQWLQNYGYNALNSGGHGNVEGLRAWNAMVMGHTTLREARGTIQLYNQNGTERHSRGEGIGDSLNPNSRIRVVKGIDIDADSEDLNRQFYTPDRYFGINISRRLPVRAWGIRTATDFQQFFAGDSTEIQNTNAINTVPARFDGGPHDSSMYYPHWLANTQDTTLDNSIDAANAIPYATVPVGFVANDFTTEAHPFERNTRQSNSPIKEQDEQIGIGRSIGITKNGMLAHDAMAAGAWDYELNDQRPTSLPVSKPVLWLKADALDLEDGQSVSTWVDSSENKWEFTQGTASAQPTFIKRDPVVNNHPVIDCDGSDYLQIDFQEKLNPIEMTLFTVAYVDSDDGGIHGIVESRSGSPVTRSGFNLYARMDSGNSYQFWMGSNTGWITTSTATNSAEGQVADILTGKIYGGDGVGSAATIELYENGQGPYSTTGPFWRSTGSTYMVGRVPNSFYLNGKIAEVIQYDRKLTAAEQYEVEAYLSRKYGIPISTSASSSHTGIVHAVDTIPINKGSDPWIDLVQRSGSLSYPQQDSAGAIEVSSSTSRYGASSPFYHLRGNAFKTNIHAVNEAKGRFAYPPGGFHEAEISSNAISRITPDLMTEISDVRQIQSRTEPRLGLVMEVESERKSNNSVDYSVVGTRAVSLHTDKMLGYQFPVLPSHMINTHYANQGFTVNGVGSASTLPDFNKKPTWSPDSNASKGAILGGDFATDTTRSDFKTHALDHWAVRGVADLPAWGGVYILRKTYLNRSEDSDNLRTEVDGNTGKATPSHPTRKYVDYIVRPVRPLKLFGFASDLVQDGWTMGARCSIPLAGYNHQPFHRDKRYGIFEMNVSRNNNQVEPITSATSAFTIDYPDANDFDVVWHLIPTANTLQHFKSDAHRYDDEGNFNPDIEARYSQTSHSGGGEPVYQSETNYAVQNGIMGDHSIHQKVATVKQPNNSLSIYPKVKVLSNIGGNVYGVDNGLALPLSGYLIALGLRGRLKYTRSENNITFDFGSLDKIYTQDSSGNWIEQTNYIGLTLYYSDVPLKGHGITLGLVADWKTKTFNDVRSNPNVMQAVSPSFVDNAVIAMQLQSQAWYKYDSTSDTVAKTALSYRGLMHYEPSDFVMASQAPFKIFDGSSQGVVTSLFGNENDIYVDSEKLSENYFPPYLFDSNNIRWRIAEIINDKGRNVMVFKEMSEKSLSDSGMTVGEAIVGQFGYIGVRTTDAALHLLNDAGGSNTGVSITPSEEFTKNTRDVEGYLNAHPMLRQINDHSLKYIARDTRGLNTMEVLRNLSQLDGRQIMSEKNGTILFSGEVFKDRGLRLGNQNGMDSIHVSKLFDSPNEIVIVGDVIAGNEIVFVRVADAEKIRQAAANGAQDEGLVKTLRQQIPGIKSVAAARKLAKTLLARAENGAPMITIKGMMNATSVLAGDIVDVNFPNQGVVGKFAVFEAKHNYQSLRSDFVIGQYEKGLEGLLSDVKTNTIDVSGISQSAGDKDIQNNITMSASFNVITVHRVRVRNVNETGFIIGARHKNGLGKIGVRDGNKRGFPIGMSKSRNYVVK